MNTFLYLFLILRTVLAGPAPQVWVQPPFALQNGMEALAQNAAFAKLSPTSPCTIWQLACIGEQFAQCSYGKWAIQPCGPGTICTALPLVHSPGTTIACDTQADAMMRISITGATKPSTPPPPAFYLQNGKDAQALNKQFKSIKAGFPCTLGPKICLGAGKGSCVKGKYVLSACSKGQICAALPLVSTPGTTVVCDAPADIVNRIKATGAGASMTG